MKNILLFLLAATGSTVTLAQNKHNLFADVAILFNPRVSVTYDMKVVNHLDVGAGVSAIYFYRSSQRPFYPACYIDVRPYWGKKKHTWFVAADAGIINFNEIEKPTVTTDPFGFYSALAYGYQYRMNKRGMGPYLSAGMFGYIRSFHSSNPKISPEHRDYKVFDATSMLQLGFKF